MQCVEREILTLFQSKGGFIEGTPDDLPPPRRELRTEPAQLEGAAEAARLAARGESCSRISK